MSPIEMPVLCGGRCSRRWQYGRVSDEVADMWAFETDRLSAGPWHEVADWLDVDLSRVVTEMLTVRTTVALPESWQGEHSVDSARVWINDRDRAIVLNSDGELMLVRLNPNGYVEDARTTIIGRTWAHPAYARNCVYARSDTEIVCVVLTVVSR